MAFRLPSICVRRSSPPPSRQITPIRIDITSALPNPWFDNARLSGGRAPAKFVQILTGTHTAAIMLALPWRRSNAERRLMLRQPRPDGRFESRCSQSGGAAGGWQARRCGHGQPCPFFLLYDRHPMLDAHLLLPDHRRTALAVLKCRAQVDVSSTGSRWTSLRAECEDRIFGKAARTRAPARVRPF